MVQSVSMALGTGTVVQLVTGIVGENSGPDGHSNIKGSKDGPVGD